MSDWQARLVAEESELAGKLDKLGEFMDDQKCDALPVEDRVLLELQHNYMAAYANVLARRIDRLPKYGE